MARPEKVAVVDEVRTRLGDASATVLTEYRGLTVAEMRRLRTELRKVGAEYRVAKNTLVRIAAKDAGFDVPRDLLTGPTAVAFAGDDPVAAAKVLRQFSRENPELVIKGGLLEGNVLSAEETLKLADLASREELLAQLAGLMEAVLAQPARLALASLSKAARLFAALQDKRTAAGETLEAPVAAADSPAADAADAVAPAADPAPEGPSGDQPAPEQVVEPGPAAEADAPTDES